MTSIRLTHTALAIAVAAALSQEWPQQPSKQCRPSTLMF